MQMPESTVPALKALQKNGHKIFLCSGRARGIIKDPRLLDIGFDGIVAACGNHIEIDGKVVYEKLLTLDIEELSYVHPGDTGADKKGGRTAQNLPYACCAGRTGVSLD